MNTKCLIANMLLALIVIDVMYMYARVIIVKGLETSLLGAIEMLLLLTL